MRNAYLGDSLDLAKRALLRVCRSLEWQTLVAPLRSQRIFDAVRYCQIIGLGPNDELFDPPGVPYGFGRRLKHLRLLAIASGQRAFNAVLLDPDLGVGDEQQVCNRVISADEVLMLTGENTVALVYHHQQACNRNYFQVMQLLGQGQTFAYDFGKAAVIVVGGQPGARAVLQRAVGDALNPSRLHVFSP